ncbi:germination protein [Paenibacillus baekrokdamisoli]|uniref:Germination protein n=1 Tax=Paenibacillus baekrokdamisoli TaxID=1712516 RepID=A0A3G9IQ04_9BACL|nr:Ger(x)C family spore germination protein [Paenibacillus baekrokdamisoli]MBB3072051.1 spore germination protein KC [Paenibacillus baekrokdamisoli]BBH20352.1 germination protein [Paenibacillus baekrokdamisoli]
MKRIQVVTLLLLFVTVHLTGCDGAHDIDELAIVTAVGLDKGERRDSLKITVQIVRPADARGQTGTPSGGTGEPIYSVSAEGKTIFEAIRNLARFSSRRIFWAHNFIVVISDKVAKSGIADIIDFFTRNHELRLKTWIVVTPDKAGQLISTNTGIEVISGDSLDKLFRYNRILAEAPSTNLMRLQESYLSESSHPFLAKLKLKKRGIPNKNPEKSETLNQAELSGVAVFKKDKMLGWLSPAEARGLLFFVEKVESGVFPLSCPDQSGGKVSIELRKQKFKVTPTYVNKEVKFDVKLTTQGDLVESGCTTRLADMRRELEKELAAKLQSNLTGVVAMAQKVYKVDFLKLGETFQNRYPEEWKWLRKDWEAEFLKAKVSVKVDANITSAVLLQRATKLKKNGDLK